MNIIELESPETEVACVSTWVIDPAHSCVEFAVSHLGIGLIKGRFVYVTGSLEIDEGDVSNSRVEVQIDAGSIDTGYALRDTHIRSASFFDVVLNPVIGFRSRKVDPLGPRRLLLHGELSLGPLVCPVVLDVAGRGRAVDPQGSEREGYSASGVLDRRDLGLDWNRELPSGGMLLGNEVSIAIELEVIKSAVRPRAAEGDGVALYP